MKDPRANPWYLSQTRLAIVLGKSNLGEQSEARRTNRLTIKGSFIIPELYLVPLINMMIPDVFFNPSPGHFYCSAIYEIGCETLVLIFHVCWGGGHNQTWKSVSGTLNQFTRQPPSNWR